MISFALIVPWLLYFAFKVNISELPPGVHAWVRELRNPQGFLLSFKLVI